MVRNGQILYYESRAKKFPDTGGKELRSTLNFIVKATRKIESPLTDVVRFVEEAGLEKIS